MNRILVPLDGSDIAAQVLPHASYQAQRWGSQVVLLRVLESQPANVGWFAKSTALPDPAEAEAYLERTAQELTAEGLDVDYVLEHGLPAETIIDVAGGAQVDLITMSTHGRSGIGRWVYGSVADKVLQGADIPIFLIRAEPDPEPVAVTGYRRLLVPLDGSELAELALSHAERWAQTCNAEIILLRVPTLPSYTPLGPEATMLVPTLLSEAYQEADSYLANVSRRLKAKGLVIHRAAVDPGAVAETVIDYARESAVDCIVMSTHGRSGLRRWVYGSVADRVLRGADLPILLIRPQRRATGV